MAKKRTLFFHVKDFNKKEVLPLRTRVHARVSRFLRSLQRSNVDVYIRVTYPNGAHNDGHYKTWDDLWHAFGAFTEDYFAVPKESLATGRFTV